MRYLKFNIIVVVLSVLITACSGYNRMVKGDDYVKKFEFANELYAKKQYLRSVTLYEQIYQRMPKTGEGELAYYRIGKAYFQEKDYTMGGYYLTSFTQRFPFSPKAADAQFSAAICAVNNSPDYTNDQNDTEIAINALQTFINTYPTSELVDSCNKIMDQLRLKIETKDFEAVRLYAKTENYRAAVVATQSFLENYPLTKSKEEAHYILVKNSYFLAMNSIDNKKMERIDQTIERYRTFVTEFPNSKFKVELTQMNDRMNKELQNFNSGK
ncbi:MAG: outer membrane protein assembly factor BamD [Crocinitomicaceae bacterium]|nr:outer membrane protein assembly factor BamD [Crocinitomicaceae bacterium]